MAESQPPAPATGTVSSPDKPAYVSASSGVPKLDPEPLTIDNLIRTRAALTPDTPIVSYPSSGIDYVDYTPVQLDAFAYNTAQHYKPNMPSRQSSDEKPHVVALLGPSNLEYLVSMLALTKMGCTVLYLSIRISEEAHRSLLMKTECRDIVVHESFQPMASTLKSSMPDLRVHEFAGEDIFRKTLPEGTETRMDYHLDPRKENKYVAWIIHSSGSTSLPKPVYLYHFAVLNNYTAHNIPLRGYITMPLYHSHGVGTLFKAFYSGKGVHIYSADLPLTANTMKETMKKHDFGIFHGVPYALKLLAEDDEAVDLLAKCKVVLFGGSSCPDSLGDMLTKRGVFLVSHYGTTETGQLMSSERHPGDQLWNYVRPSAKSRPYLRFEDRGSGLVEVICLDGWPGKVMTNREDGSYATRDLFTRHPDPELEALKYFSRLDDTITLVSGEKANPLLIEGLVRQNVEVKETVAFGAGRAQIGLLLFPSDIGAVLPPEVVLDRIWPSVEEAHQEMPEYARLSRSMVKIMPADADYRKTDKRTIIRQAVYKQYAAEIDAMYDDEGTREGDLHISGQALEDFLRDQVHAILGGSVDVAAITSDADFFKLGMDSLKVAQLRTAIVSRIFLNGARPGLNVAFDCPSVRALAAKLEALRDGVTGAEATAEDEMKELIATYGSFTQPQIEQNVLLTGVTGSLGAHIAHILAKRDDVKRVYCLVRASSPQKAQDRALQSLETRRILTTLTPEQSSKIVALPSDLSKPTLGLTAGTLEELRNQITAVVHSAWSVNFNLRLSSFVDDCLAGTRHLIDLCLHSRRRPSFNFCSSVSTQANAPRFQVTPETLPASFDHAQGIGYAQSKLVAETMCIHASETTGLTARVLRVGQISGDTEQGVWNPTEALPLMFQTALTTGALPQLDEAPRWLPVDVVAATAIDLSLPVTVPTGVYNIISPHPFHWTRDLLPLLRGAGLSFSEVSAKEWVAGVTASSPDPQKNPPIKLAEYFKQRYGADQKPKPPAKWATDQTEKYSPSFRGAPLLNQNFVSKMVKYWKGNSWNVQKGSA